MHLILSSGMKYICIQDQYRFLPEFLLLHFVFSAFTYFGVKLPIGG